MCVPEKKVQTHWPQRPRILPNDDDEGLARAEALEKESRWIDEFIERLAGALKGIAHKK